MRGSKIAPSHCQDTSLIQQLDVIIRSQHRILRYIHGENSSCLNGVVCYFWGEAQIWGTAVPPAPLTTCLLGRDTAVLSVAIPAPVCWTSVWFFLAKMDGGSVFVLSEHSVGLCDSVHFDDTKWCISSPTVALHGLYYEPWQKVGRRVLFCSTNH